MNTPLDESDASVEQQLASLQPCVSANDLRSATLGQVRRELRAARWDRRLGRTAMLLLAVGIGMSVLTLQRPVSPRGGQLAVGATNRAIVELAVTIADATDVETARSIVLHLATLSGLPLSIQQTDALGSEIDRRLSPTLFDKKAG